ncbi:MAG: hypothetical protein WDZ48_01330 [Pirellulales bacterium]
MSRTLAILSGLVVAGGLSTGGAIAAESPLLAGTASVDITPGPGQKLWGYSNRRD